MKQYIQIEGLAFKLDGWTEKQTDDFLDKLVELAESYGDEVQFTGSVWAVSEDELEDE